MKRERKKIGLSLLTGALFSWLLIGCVGAASKELRVPDYSSVECWYIADSVNKKNTPTDVFYILPTYIEDWKDQEGRLFHHMDVYNEDQRTKVKSGFELANSIFAENSRFFSPYYRQITLQSWALSEEELSQRYEIAQQDINAAFESYMTHYNQGRPFILAGFSQGGKGVVELLKRLTPEQYSQLIAAYVVGYKITNEEIASHPYIVPACDSVDLGVTICFNSVARPEAATPSLIPTDVCINPVNWRTDSTTAWMNDSVSVAIDPSSRLLIVSGLDEEALYIESLGYLFPKGNFHLYEYPFHGERLRENVAKRIHAYQKRQSSATN